MSARFSVCYWVVLLFDLWLAPQVRAEVTRVDIAARADVGMSGYEKIVGTIHFAVDPKKPRNRLVADLDKAPVNDEGLVEFSSDLYILRPKATPGNGVALVDILNRGNKLALNGFNRGGAPDPATENDLGDRFLMRFGYTIVWVGWEFDVSERTNAMRIRVPVATDAGKAITGIVTAKWTATAGGNEFIVGDLAAYDAIDPAGADSRLLACPGIHVTACAEVPRGRWRLDGHTVSLDAGFQPGTTYRVAYRAANPPIGGLGFVAVRDAVSWLKHQPDAVAPVRYAYGYGASQSGRFLRSFLYEGFNTDEKNRQVLDAVLAHIAGASRIDLNARWAKPSSLAVYDATSFPFADASLKDPVSSVREGELDNPRTAGAAPKVFYTNTAVEYWGTGRAAAMIHISPDGKSDVTLPDNVRVYFLAGTQHTPARFPPSVNNGQQPDNSVDYWWTMRALLLAMNRWVKEGVAPPASRYPRLADRTLVRARDVAFPAIPGVPSPRTLTAGERAVNALIAKDGGAGSPLPLFVPQVDDDGNERSGIRLPDIAVPLATYTGWNFRSTTIGAPDELVSLLGSSIPFRATRAGREAAHDPRRSVEERYGSKDEYLVQVEEAADALVKDRYLLIDDVPRILQRASDTWDLVAAPSGLRDSLRRDADLHLVTDEEPSGFERRVPKQPEVLAVDRELGLESDARVPPGVLRGAEIGHRQRHLAGNAANRERAGHVVLVGALLRDARARERNRRVLVHREEVLRPQMLIAIGGRRIDARRTDGERNRRVLGVRRIEIDRAVEVGEPAAHFRDQMAYLEEHFRMRLVDRKGRRRRSRGSGGRHVDTSIMNK
jgi:hypothetical protein